MSHHGQNRAYICRKLQMCVRMEKTEEMNACNRIPVDGRARRLAGAVEACSGWLEECDVDDIGLADQGSEHVLDAGV